jgi:hypothetical protein
MKIYFRQSLVYNDSFSCGIRIETDDGDSISIVRYNGGSHVHENKLEGNKFEYVPHIHVATERYYRISKRMVDAYAETTDRYTTLNDAIKCILADCNIKGFNMDVLQYTEDLFDGLESS